MIDPVDLLAAAAYERASAALAGAVEEMCAEGRPLPEGALAVLLKHLLAHFDGLDAHYRDLFDPEFQQQLRERAAEVARKSRRDRGPDDG